MTTPTRHTIAAAFAAILLITTAAVTTALVLTGAGDAFCAGQDIKL